MQDGFFRAAAAVPQMQPANCQHNAQQIISLAKQAIQQNISALVFPELCLTGCTCGSLFLQQPLLFAAQQSLQTVLSALHGTNLLYVIGLPVSLSSNVYNCAAVCLGSKILGIVPKTHCSNRHASLETLYFSPAPSAQTITLCEQTVLFGTDLLFACSNLPHLSFGVEIGTDANAITPPAHHFIQAGATLILHPCAYADSVIATAQNCSPAQTQSALLLCAYVSANAGAGESTTDAVFSGQTYLAENGVLLAQSTPFSTGLTSADFDLTLLLQERRLNGRHTHPDAALRTVSFALPVKSLQLNRPVTRNPFLPPHTADLPEYCETILNIQAQGLKTRLQHIGSKNVVVGVSGGLDSALALLVCARAFSLLQYDPSGITAVSMPCFGTTERTRQNANTLAQALGCTFREIDLSAAVHQHFQDISHPVSEHNIVFENAQARQRTQVLMNIANQTGGLVVGTGDLSESALGWATYGGDHLSMYNVNASVPKTVCRCLVAHCAGTSTPTLANLLQDILQTPVSPELLPPQQGDISQKTEALIGPYDLHDFVLYYTLRYGFAPHKIFRLAHLAFNTTYDNATIKHWMTVFYQRFFAQQFKRSCLPDGPAISTLSLSPRTNWHMPSDASPENWLADLNTIS